MSVVDTSIYLKFQYGEFSWWSEEDKTGKVLWG